VNNANLLAEIIRKTQHHGISSLKLKISCKAGATNLGNIYFQPTAHAGHVFVTRDLDLLTLK